MGHLILNKKKITAEEIRSYYDTALEALKQKSNQDGDRYSSEKERIEAFQKAKTELSIEAGFMLLAYVESLFRADFAARVEKRKPKDNLTEYFREIYPNHAAPLFKVRLEDILNGWKNESGLCSETMERSLQNLPQYFKYRHWIAHGRYWEFKEKNYIERYKFDEISELVDNIEMQFKTKLQTLCDIGDKA